MFAKQKSTGGRKPKAKPAGRLSLPLKGGCHCGALRYRVTAMPKDSGYCHCADCQKTTGAPTTAWFAVGATDFSYVKGAPSVYKSSAWGQREFCGVCGCQILYRPQKRARRVTVNAPTLDKPGAVPPRRHIFDSSRIAWFDTTDDLPRKPRG
ncbi:MAG: GFA family protein [Dongiaceae bacterium]